MCELLARSYSLVPVFQRDERREGGAGYERCGGGRTRPLLLLFSLEAKGTRASGAYISARNTKYNLHKTVNGLVLHLSVQNRTVFVGENYD